MPDAARLPSSPIKAYGCSTPTRLKHALRIPAIETHAARHRLFLLRGTVRTLAQKDRSQCKPLFFPVPVLPHLGFQVCCLRPIGSLPLWNAAKPPKDGACVIVSNDMGHQEGSYGIHSDSKSSCGGVTSLTRCRLEATSSS